MSMRDLYELIPNDELVEPRYYDQLVTTARVLERIFNGDQTGQDRETGVIVLVFPANNEENDLRISCISNCHQVAILEMLKKQVARFERGLNDYKGAA